MHYCGRNDMQDTWKQCSSIQNGLQCNLRENHEGGHDYCDCDQCQYTRNLVKIFMEIEKPSVLFRPYQLQAAFDKAEVDTAHMFDGQTCMMKTVEGHNDCPICYFRKQVKKPLRIG